MAKTKPCRTHDIIGRAESNTAINQTHPQCEWPTIPAATMGSLEMDSPAQQNSWSVGLGTDQEARNAWVSYYRIAMY